MRKLVASVALATVVAVGGLLGAMPAKASTWTFAVSDLTTGGLTIRGDGLFNVTGSGPDFLVTGISGTYYNLNDAGHAITSLFAPGGFQGNDNILRQQCRKCLTHWGSPFPWPTC